MKQYIVYIYRDTQNNNEALYVGQGTVQRSNDHIKACRRIRSAFYNKLNKMLESNNEPRIDRFQCDSREHSYEMEKKLIKMIGRKDKGLGPLLNLTDGGPGGVFTHSPTQVRKMREALTGRKQSQEHIKKRVQANTGSKRTEEQRKRIGDGIRNGGKMRKPWTTARRNAQIKRGEL